MKGLLLIPVCFVALLVPVALLAGGGDGFDGVVRSIETKYHVHATRIPFLGLISSISRRSAQEGVNHVHVAEFEGMSGAMDGDELNGMVQAKLGPAWERVIREASRKDGSQTLIFMRPEGSQMGLFVLDADGNDLNVVQVSVDPSHLAESVNHYGHHNHDAIPNDGDVSE